MSLFVIWSQAWSKIYKSRTLKNVGKFYAKALRNYHWSKLEIWRIGSDTMQKSWKKIEVSARVWNVEERQYEGFHWITVCVLSINLDVFGCFAKDLQILGLITNMKKILGSFITKMIQHLKIFIKIFIC